MMNLKNFNFKKFLSSEYKLFIYPMIVALASFCLIFFLIVPQLKDFLVGQGDLDQAKTRLSSLDVKAKELESINNSDLNHDLLLALYALPVEKDFSILVGILKELASQSGVNLLSLHLGSSQDPNEFIIKADLIGSSSALGTLLNNIEKTPRVMKVRSVESAASGVGNTISATVAVTVFFSPAPKSLGAIDSSLPKLSDKDQVILTGLSRSNVTSAVPVLAPAGKADPFQ